MVSSTATDSELLAKLNENTFIVPHAVVDDDHIVLQRFVHFAGNELATLPHEIAILSESETAYGSGLQSLTLQSPKSSDDSAPLRMTFPREIYRLRYLSTQTNRVPRLHSTGRPFLRLPDFP